MAEKPKRASAVSLILVMLLFCVGCVHAGVVQEKEFIPAHITYSPYYVVINHRPYYMTRWLHFPDRWQVLVEDEEGHREWWTVSEAFYHSVEVGDYVEKGGADDAEP